MGGVNLTEESRNIMASNAELLSGQMRSIKDETFLNMPALIAKINAKGKSSQFEHLFNNFKIVMEKSFIVDLFLLQLKHLFVLQQEVLAWMTHQQKSPL